jgi:chromosome segregation ATPase
MPKGQMTPKTPPGRSGNKRKPTPPTDAAELRSLRSELKKSKTTSDATSGKLLNETARLRASQLEVFNLKKDVQGHTKEARRFEREITRLTKELSKKEKSVAISPNVDLASISSTLSTMNDMMAGQARQIQSLLDANKSMSDRMEAQQQQHQQQLMAIQNTPHQNNNSTFAPVFMNHGTGQQQQQIPQQGQQPQQQRQLMQGTSVDLQQLLNMFNGSRRNDN